jgi:hypothetical protein
MMMHSKRFKNFVIGLGVFTLVTLGLGKFFDSRCETSCIGEAFAANSNNGLEFKLDNDKRIVLGPNILITLDDEDDGHATRIDEPVTETFPGKDLKEVHIKSFTTDWKVVDSADEQLRLVFRGYVPKEWTIRQEGGKLDLELKKKGPREGELQLPKNFAGSITLNSVSGEIQVEQLAQAQDFRLNNVSGDVQIKAAPSRRLSINTVSGDVELQASNLNKDLGIDSKSVSGDVIATLISPIKELRSESVSGNMELKAGKAVGFEFEMEGVSASFEGLPNDARRNEGFGNRSAAGSFGADPKGRLRFTSVSGDFSLKPAD